MEKHRSEKLPFKPRSRMLLLLGDQLIRDSGIAVFELVKNAYDADSPNANKQDLSTENIDPGAVIEMLDIEQPEKGMIIIEDSGTGMDWKTITEVWLEPGTDFRHKQFEKMERTPKYHRLPLGAKGIGRFASHKLGEKIKLITRKKDNPEIVVEIDWNDFKEKRYLEDYPVLIVERDPQHFTDDSTGTRIEISGLREKWTRGMVRDLHRAVMSICSPFRGPGEFKVKLSIKPDLGWTEHLLEISDVLEKALFRASCILDGKKMIYDYEFRPLQGMDRVDGRKFMNKEMFLNVDLKYDDETGRDPSIGMLYADFYIFDLDPRIMDLGISDKKGFKQFLSENGGIRVYRDGIRVYDYGEPGNDWLNLGGARVNDPSVRISNNIVIGAVALKSEESTGLLEKTNREGFVENRSTERFREVVKFALQQIVEERNIDKDRIRKAYSKAKQKEPVLDDLNQLRFELEKRGIIEDLGIYLDRIENQFRDVRDRLMTAAGAGLSLSVVIHEVEKGIGELNKAVDRDVSIEQVKSMAEHLYELIEGLTYLIRKSGVTNEKASVLIKQALFNTEYRLRYHNARSINGLEIGCSDFSARCTRRLIIACLMNLIDNAIYWLDNKGAEEKKVYIGTSQSFKAGPAIVVADNGPGFADPPEYLVQPFFTRKPDGMGLGLHLASEVMKIQGGRLEFPEKGDIDIPEIFGGAVVALVFGGVK